MNVIKHEIETCEQILSKPKEKISSKEANPS